MGKTMMPLVFSLALLLNGCAIFTKGDRYPREIDRHYEGMLNDSTYAESDARFIEYADSSKVLVSYSVKLERPLEKVEAEGYPEGAAIKDGKIFSRGVPYDGLPDRVYVKVICPNGKEGTIRRECGFTAIGVPQGDDCVAKNCVAKKHDEILDQIYAALMLAAGKEN